MSIKEWCDQCMSYLPSHTHEFNNFHVAEKEYNELRSAVIKVKELLNTKGISDSGKEYNVYCIACVHVGQEEKMNAALQELFDLI